MVSEFQEHILVSKNRRLVDIDKLTDAVFVLTDNDGNTRSFTYSEITSKLSAPDSPLLQTKGGSLSLASVSRRINGLLKRKADSPLNDLDNEMIINCLENFDGSYPTRFFSKIGYYLEDLSRRKGLSPGAMRAIDYFTEKHPKLTDKPPVYTSHNERTRELE
jgi:hypothetical protein